MVVDRRLKTATRLSWALAGLNVAFAVVSFAGFWWHIGMARMHIIGAYRDLDTRGVIDQAVLREHFGSRLADDWFLVGSEYLPGDLLDRMVRFALVIGVFFVVNAVLCACAAVWLSRLARAGPGGGKSG